MAQLDALAQIDRNEEVQSMCIGVHGSIPEVNWELVFSVYWKLGLFTIRLSYNSHLPVAISRLALPPPTQSRRSSASISEGRIRGACEKACVTAFHLESYLLGRAALGS